MCACTFVPVTARTRILAFGLTLALVLAGGTCAALVGGVTGQVLTIVLISAGVAGVVLLVFLESASAKIVNSRAMRSAAVGRRCAGWRPGAGAG